MSDNGRITLIFFCNILLYFVVGEINFFLNGLSLHFHADVLLILFSGLYLGRMSGLVCTSLLGFLADSVAPVPHGTYVIGYLFIWLFLVWGQRRIRRQNKVHLRSLATIAQLLWMASLTVIIAKSAWGHSVYMQRALMEILFSMALTYALAWPWCNFQKNLLFNLGWNIEAEYSHL